MPETLGEVSDRDVIEKYSTDIRSTDPNSSRAELTSGLSASV